MENVVNGVQTPEGAEGDNSAVEINAIYTDATALPEGETLASDEETYLELEDYAGRRFVASTDLTRAVKVFPAKSGVSATIRLTRTGKNESNGCFVKAVDVAAGFRVNAGSYPTHTEVSFLLANGKVLTGYVFNTEKRKGYYFPKVLAANAITLPKLGKRLPFVVTKLIVG